MSQFTIYKNTNKDTSKAYPYFMDVQSSLLENLNTRVVIPLTKKKKDNRQYPESLCPIININGKKYILLTHQITSVSVSFLEAVEISALENKDEILPAIDFLVTGI